MVYCRLAAQIPTEAACYKDSKLMVPFQDRSKIAALSGGERALIVGASNIQLLFKGLKHFEQS